MLPKNHHLKILPIFAVAVFLLIFSLSKAGVLGTTSTTYDTNTGSTTETKPPGFYAGPKFVKIKTGGHTSLHSGFYDGTNWFGVASLWKVVNQDAGNLSDYSGTEANQVYFKAGSKAGTFEKAVVATCADHKCLGQVAYITVEVYTEATSYCGDNSCNSGEDCSTCAKDCGTCPTPPPDYPVCGNSVCESGEDYNSCLSDCPKPTVSSEEKDNTSTVPSTYCEGLFMGQSDSKYDCVKKTLGGDFDYFNARKNGPDCRNEKKWHELSGKAYEACFKTNETTTPTEETKPPTTTEEGQGTVYPAEPPLEVSQCVIDKLGEERYKALASGSIQPTEKDMEVFKTCSGKENGDTITYKQEKELDDKTKACLTLAVGEKRFKEINEGAKPTPEEVEKGRKCFGTQTSQGAPPPRYEIPKEIETCLKEKLGEKRFNELKSGKIKPTDKEKKDANTCFEKLNPVEKSVLPAPPEKVPFIEEKEELKVEVVKTETVKEEVEKDGEKVQEERPRIVLSGKALPNTTVDIYIFSTPIVVSTKTDANGIWTYYLENPLDPGDHSAYVVAKQDDGAEVRSGVFTFRVAAAEDGQDSLIVESTTPSTLSTYLWEVAALLSAAILLALGIFTIRVRRRS